MQKPIKRSAAIIIRDSSSVGRGKFLAVLRPPGDEELPSVWGLPAVTLGGGEAWDVAIVRAGREKLGVELRGGAELIEGRLERRGYTLHMKLFEALIERGAPVAPQPIAGVTQYSEWKWAEPAALVDGARRGSLCSRLYLAALGEDWA